MATGEESQIYVLAEDGQHQAYAESEAQDLLLKKVLSPETLYWKEGMAEWRPLSELPQPFGYDIVPPKRAPDSDYQSWIPGQSPIAPPEPEPEFFPPPPPPPPPPEPTFDAPPPPPLSEPAAPPPPVIPPPMELPPVHAQIGLPPLSLPPLPTTTLSEKEKGRRKSNRHYFRTNPLFLTRSYQFLAVVVLGLNAYFIARCLDLVQAGTSEYLDRVYLYFIGITGLGLYFFTAVLFYVWVYYTSRNCRVFTNSMRFSPGWAVGWFFVPIMNLFRPYQVIQEIWKISTSPRQWKEMRDSLFVGLWFVLRLAVGILSGYPIHTRYSDSPVPGAQELDPIIHFAIIAAAIWIATFFNLVLVTVIIRRQVAWVRAVEPPPAVTTLS